MDGFQRELLTFLPRLHTDPASRGIRAGLQTPQGPQAHGRKGAKRFLCPAGRRGTAPHTHGEGYHQKNNTTKPPPETNKHWQRQEKLEACSGCWRGGKTVQLLREVAWQLPRQASLGFPCDPANLCPFRPPDTCTLVFTAAERQKRPKWPSWVTETQCGRSHNGLSFSLRREGRAATDCDGRGPQKHAQ